MKRRWTTTPRTALARTLRVALTAIFAAGLLTPAGAAAAASGPALETPAATLDAALHCPAFAHTDRDPVLLVHGTSLQHEESWEWGMAPALRADGYDVCGVDLPNRAMGDVQVSTEYVVHAVRVMQAATGRKVDIIGHSQGNMEARWAVKWWPDVQAATDDVVMLGNPGRGVVAGNFFCVAPCAPALHQFSMGSNFLDALNATDETPGAVSYTSIYSLTDEAIVPATTAPLNGARNVAIQGVCFGRVVSHGGLLYDSVTYLLVKDALAHAGGADPGRLPFGKCLDVFLPGVDAIEAADATATGAAILLGELANATKVQAEPPLKAYAL